VQYKKALLYVIGLFVMCSVQAHEAVVDSYGCHSNVAHGTYHCHKGPLAGQQYKSQADMLRALREQDQAVRPKPKLQPARF
jgi:hypothetical protein